MNFSFHYDKQPSKFLKGCEKQTAGRIVDKTEDTLSKSPVPHNAVKVVGEQGIFRIRIGDFRVLYRIDYQQGKIVIVRIDKRDSVYRN